MIGTAATIAAEHGSRSLHFSIRRRGPIDEETKKGLKYVDAGTRLTETGMKQKVGNAYAKAGLNMPLFHSKGKGSQRTALLFAG